MSYYSRRIKYFAIFVLLILLHSVECTISNPPTNYISNHDITNYDLPYDDIYDDDVKNPSELNTNLVWIYAFTITPYIDNINGIVWKNTLGTYVY